MNVSDCGLTDDDVLYEQNQVTERLAEIATELDTQYRGSELLIVGVLNGAFMIVADLVRLMASHVEIDWVGVSSYGGGTRSSGTIRPTKDMTEDVRGRHVLLVDDILDSGLTLSWLRSRIEAQGAASIASCVLLRKPAHSGRKTEVEYVGFDIPDVFAVGYGLDHAGRYRGLQCIAHVTMESPTRR